MFCPSCRDEFRAGFTRCASCGVDLVPELGASAPRASGPAVPPAAPAAGPVPMAEYCGFLELDEAREARARLRGLGIRTEVVLRDAAHAPDAEEYWLRVERARLAEAAQELGYHEVEESDAAQEFRCEECGASVPADASACPRCGLKFEDAT
jgi:hypothetical protein